MRIGTSYFVSRHSALRYYKSQEGDATLATIDRKIADGEIHIGKPSCEYWQRLVIIDHGTRYAIEDDDGTTPSTWKRRPDIKDFILNVAGLDLYAVAHMSPEALRATLLEYREEAIKIAETWERRPS